MNRDDIFGEKGLLSQTLPGFSLRPSQQQMAEAIAEAIETHSPLVVEAGTGTGKTFAYLVPILLAGKKTVLSTGTRNLQDQLFQKDLPVIRDLLASPLRIVLLKGRSNYLCHYRFHQLENGERLLPREEVKFFPTVAAWLALTRTGDMAEVPDLPEETSLCREVTSTVDSCLGQECPFVKDCFVLKARRTAMAADIVVVNHHLFLSDLALQEEGVGELLPDAEVVVFDEAHELPELLSQFFSTRLSGRQLLDLARDSLTEIATGCPDMPDLVEAVRKLQAGVREMRLALGTDNQRTTWPLLLPEVLTKTIGELTLRLTTLAKLLSTVAERTKGLESCAKRATTLVVRLRQLTAPAEAEEDCIRWFETHQQGFTLQLTPLIVADTLKPFLEAPGKTRIFTSATLTVANRFQSFVETLGLKAARQLQLESPFHYAEQALLYVPRGMPDPRKPGYTVALMQAVLPLLQLTGGRTFLLFTSYRAMDEAADWLAKAGDFTLLVQGTLPKRILLDQFITLERTVLLGTTSFWQGVDVRGQALSCVVIDRLPFASPEDPILQARIRQIRALGQDPFQACQLAEAVLALKQGAGRLIRDRADKGVLMIGDPRLVGARYGEAFLRSLPPMGRTRDFEKVREFLQFSLPAFFIAREPEEQGAGSGSSDHV